MNDALFLNGVYKSVLEEIFEAQGKDTSLVCYLQPYSTQTIKRLEKETPTPSNPLTMYISLTNSLGSISYAASIVGWEDKRDLFKNTERLERLKRHISEHQPKEVSIHQYLKKDKSKPYINLIAIKNLTRISIGFSVKNLIKTSDDEPLKVRKRSGGWSPVHLAPEWVDVEETTFWEAYDKDLAEKVSTSQKESYETLLMNADAAPKKPERIQIISQGFKRNSNVIALVLRRANGICELCKKDAPFMRKSDGTPYLEVHHKNTLANDGDDSVENAIAVCPNCHRKEHFGV